MRVTRDVLSVVALGCAAAGPVGAQAISVGPTVIAETTDLPAKFVTIVSTDDQGRPRRPVMTCGSADRAGPVIQRSTISTTTR
jgi:hypothetical protein